MALPAFQPCPPGSSGGQRGRPAESDKLRTLSSLLASSSVYPRSAPPPPSVYSPGEKASPVRPSCTRAENLLPGHSGQAPRDACPPCPPNLHTFLPACGVRGSPGGPAPHPSLCLLPGPSRAPRAEVPSRFPPGHPFKPTSVIVPLVFKAAVLKYCRLRSVPVLMQNSGNEEVS